MTTLGIEDLIGQHGWTPVGDAQPEGSATRQEVALESGEPALLYRWDDVVMAARASSAHGLLGEELFAVPERLGSGPGWVLVEKPDGTPLSDLLSAPAAEGLSALDAGRARALVQGLGTVLRKLHAIPLAKRVGDLLGEADEGEQPRTWLTFSGYVAHQLEWFAEHLRKNDLADDVVSELNSSIADLRHELSAFHPRNPVCVCHGRLAMEHVWVDQSGREVIGLTGFERAQILPREADVAYLLWIEGLGRDRALSKAFYSGYGAARTMDVQRRERFYRRLVAFQALFHAKGDVRISTEELVTLASPKAIA